MTDRPAIEGILAANRYCVIGSADGNTLDMSLEV